MSSKNSNDCYYILMWCRSELICSIDEVLIEFHYFLETPTMRNEKVFAMMAELREKNSECKTILTPMDDETYWKDERELKIC